MFSKHDYSVGKWGDKWMVFDFCFPIAGPFDTAKEAREKWLELMRALEANK